ncbi:hypothetical protein HRH25_13360 [Flavisolibacter sp. BT320]|nr:hypothetical protein [Flavisolibacter longurius]
MITMAVNKKAGWAPAYIIILVIVASCSSAKNSMGKSAVVPAIPMAQTRSQDLCNRTVRYFIDKVLITNDNGSENEVAFSGTLIVDPMGRKITNTRTEGKRESTAELNLVNCILSGDMQNGEALYEVVESIEQENGNTTIQRTNLKIEVLKGVVNLSVTSDNKAGGVTMIATRWEVVN